MKIRTALRGHSHACRLLKTIAFSIVAGSSIIPTSASIAGEDLTGALIIAPAAIEASKAADKKQTTSSVIVCETILFKDDRVTYAKNCSRGVK